VSLSSSVALSPGIDSCETHTWPHSHTGCMMAYMQDMDPYAAYIVTYTNSIVIIYSVAVLHVVLLDSVVIFYFLYFELTAVSGIVS